MAIYDITRTVYGNTASRPAFANAKGVLYVDTEAEAAYLSDGTAWVPLGGGGGSAGPLEGQVSGDLDDTILEPEAITDQTELDVVADDDELLIHDASSSGLRRTSVAAIRSGIFGNLPLLGIAKTNIASSGLRDIKYIPQHDLLIFTEGASGGKVRRVNQETELAVDWCAGVAGVEPYWITYCPLDGLVYVTSGTGTRNCVRIDPSAPVQSALLNWKARTNLVWNDTTSLFYAGGGGSDWIICNPVSGVQTTVAAGASFGDGNANCTLCNFDGNLYAMSSTGRLLQLTPGGTATDLGAVLSGGGGNFPWVVWDDISGRLWAGGGAQTTIYEIDPSGFSITSHSMVEGLTSSVGPTGAAVDGAGRLYLGTSTTMALIVDTTTGAIIQAVKGPASSVTRYIQPPFDPAHPRLFCGGASTLVVIR